MRQYAYFSAAIRDGARMSLQAHHSLQDDDGSTCAFGAGMMAMGADDLKAPYILFPYLKTTHTACPACQQPTRLDCAIICLNDRHKWTREQIADWLYLEEEKLGFITLVEPELKSVCAETEREMKTR